MHSYGAFYAIYGRHMGFLSFSVYVAGVCYFLLADCHRLRIHSLQKSGNLFADGAKLERSTGGGGSMGLNIVATKSVEEEKKEEKLKSNLQTDPRGRKEGDRA